MTIVRVKFSRQAIPREYEFEGIAEAKKFAEEKQAHNPYVRWIEFDTKRKYPKI